MSTEQQNSIRIAKNTGYLYLRMILVTLVNLYTSRIVLQTLGFEDFGIYNVIASIIVFFSFFNNALKNASTRFLSVEIGANNSTGINQTYSMAINLHLVLALILFVVLEPIGIWWINYHLVISPDRIVAANWVFQFSLITFVFSLIQIPFDSTIIANERMDFYAIISIIEAIGKLGVAFLLIISPIDKLILYAALMMMVAILVFCGYAGYCATKITNCNYIRYWNKEHIHKFSAYSGWSLLVNTSDVMVIQGRAVLFNLFLGVVANAALGIANQVYNALAMFARNFASAFNPQIYKSYAANNRKYFMQLIFSTSKISYYLLMLPLIPLLINLPFVLELWLGKYPEHTTAYIAAMMLFAIFDALQAPLWNAIFATGNIRTHQIMAATIKILVLPLTWLALKWGDNGFYAILIWGLGNVVCAIARTIYSKGFLGLNIAHYCLDVIGRTLLVTILTIPLPIWLAYHFGQGWTALLSTTIISIILLIFFAYTLGMNKDEQNMIKNIPLVQRITAKLK